MLGCVFFFIPVVLIVVVMSFTEYVFCRHALIIDAMLTEKEISEKLIMLHFSQGWIGPLLCSWLSWEK